MKAPPSYLLTDPWRARLTDLVIKLTTFPFDQTKTFLIYFLFNHLWAPSSSSTITLTCCSPASPLISAQCAHWIRNSYWYSQCRSLSRLGTPFEWRTTTTWSQGPECLQWRGHRWVSTLQYSRARWGLALAGVRRWHSRSRRVLTWLLHGGVWGGL